MYQTLVTYPKADGVAWSCRAVVAESEKRNIAGVLGEEIQTLHFQNRSLQEEVGT